MLHLNRKTDSTSTTSAIPSSPAWARFLVGPDRPVAVLALAVLSTTVFDLKLREPSIGAFQTSKRWLCLEGEIQYDFGRACAPTLKANVITFCSTREEPASEYSDDCTSRSQRTATSATAPLTDGLSILMEMTARLSERDCNIVVRRKLVWWLDARVLLVGVR